MRDQEVDALLRALPRQRAPATFSARVLARVRSPVATPRLPLRPPLRLPLRLAAAAVTLALALGAGFALRDSLARWETQELRREIAALRGELRLVAASLTRPSPADTRGLVYVGGDERFDVVVDPAGLRLDDHGAPVVPVLYQGEEL